MTTSKTIQQRGAEADVDTFRQHLGPFVVAAETTRMAMVFTNAKAPGNPIIFANDSFLKLTGFARDDVLAKGFNAILAHGVDAHALADIAAAFDGADCCPDIHYRRKNGTECWAALFVSPVRDEGGDIIQHFVSLVDGTRQREEQVQCKMLIDELNHRVKNTLATVQSIVSQAVRRQTDVAAIRASIESRLFALSRSHDLLTRVNWEDAGLRDLIDDALEPFRVALGGPERFVITGDPITLSPKMTLALSIAFHELATNAVKYGALSNDRGTLAIGWTVRPFLQGDRLILEWREQGGPAVTPPTRKGFGSQVLERGLAHELRGSVRLQYLPGGVTCTIDIPAPIPPDLSGADLSDIAA